MLKIAMLKSRLKKLDTVVGIKPFVYLGIIAGIFPCKYVNKSLKSGGVFLRSYIFILFGIRLYVSISTFTVPPSFHQIIITSMVGLALLSIFMEMVMDFFVSAFQHNRFTDFFGKLELYDRRVARLGHPRQDGHFWYWIVLAMIGGYVYNSMSLFYVRANGSWTTFFWETSKWIAQPLIFWLCFMRFNLLVHLTYQRFRHLNKSVLPSVCWTRKLTPTNLNSVTASEFLFLHSTLLDASRIINDISSLIILVSFTTLFFTAVVDIYLMHVARDDSLFRYSYFVLAAIFLTCYICHTTAEQANSSSKNMVKDEPTLVEDSIAMDRVRMQLYFCHNPVVFTAGEFFSIDLPIFYSMLIAILTNGVLLMKSAPRPPPSA